MATFQICVFRHQFRKKDNKYPVSISVYWAEETVYIPTEYYVTIHQISQKDKKFKLKDNLIIAELTKRIEIFERSKLDLGTKIYQYSAHELKEYFISLIYKKKDESIDFIQFGRAKVAELKEAGKRWDRWNTVINSLSDFSNGELNIHDLTSRYLKKYEEYLRTERKITRKDQNGKYVTTVRKPVSNTTIAGYMSDIRAMFNDALSDYNDEEKGIEVIRHYPFKKYDIPEPDESDKRNIKIEGIQKIININKSEVSERMEFACDVFILLFGLVGISPKDIYELEDYRNGRISYNRSKTKGRRKDKAFISINVEPELLPLFEKYKDPSGERVFIFHKMFKKSDYFIASLDGSLKKVAKFCEIDEPLSTYYARHSWATIARNEAKVSKSDVSECLNHIDGNKVTDIYIEKDWSVIDEANRKVLDLVFVKNP